MRRILRRAVRYGRTLGFHEPFFFKLVDVVAKTMGDVFPKSARSKSKIKETIRREEEAFNKTLDKGIELFEGMVLFNSIATAARTQGYQVKTQYYGRSADPNLEEFTIWLSHGSHPVVDLDASQVRAGEWQEFIRRTPIVSAEDAFKLYDTYGFPLDFTELMARERGLTVDVAGFETLMDEQRERARKAQKKEEIKVSDNQIYGRRDICRI